MTTSAARSSRNRQPCHKQTSSSAAYTGPRGAHDHHLLLATRTGQTTQVQQILSSHPGYLNRVSSDDATTLLYHAAFCGHAQLLKWMLEEGGQADWQRTYMASCCPIIRDVLRPYVNQDKKEQAAIRVIRKHMGAHVHNWLWKPITRDGKPGIFARMLIRDMVSSQADGFQQLT